MPSPDNKHKQLLVMTPNKPPFLYNPLPVSGFTPWRKPGISWVDLEVLAWQWGPAWTWRWVRNISCWDALRREWRLLESQQVCQAQNAASGQTAGEGTRIRTNWGWFQVLFSISFPNPGTRLQHYSSTLYSYLSFVPRGPPAMAFSVMEAAVSECHPLTLPPTFFWNI